MILIMQTRVRDYDAWKTVFDDGEPLRAKHGCTGHEIFRGVDDGNAVTLHLRFASREAGDALRTDPELAAAMKRAGVEGQPAVTWARDGEAHTYASRRAA
jgi:quinol monooxygenase YgiN